MGHALVAIALPGTDPVHKVSIIPRGIGALGYTIQRPTEDRYLMTRGELENKMAVLLGGRAAEVIVFSELSTGASDDLNRVTELARNMVTRYGMDEKLGLVTFEAEKAHFLRGSISPYTESYHYSEETARQIDGAVHGLVTAAYERAKEILTRHLDSLEDGAKKLLEKETLTQDELPKILSR
jgi:cell division protease FtsH